eukprot:385214-Rhodomonas_salina.1
MSCTDAARVVQPVLKPGLEKGVLAPTIEAIKVGERGTTVPISPYGMPGTGISRVYPPTPSLIPCPRIGSTPYDSCPPRPYRSSPLSCYAAPGTDLLYGGMLVQLMVL